MEAVYGAAGDGPVQTSTSLYRGEWETLELY